MCNEWQQFLSQLHNRSDDRGGGSDAKKGNKLTEFYKDLIRSKNKNVGKGNEMSKKPSGSNP